MRLLKNYVCIEQTMKKKDSKIILDASADQKDKFEFSFKIIGLGPDCVGIQIGDIPIFEQHVQFQGAKIIEKDDNGMITHTIVHQDSIIALENDDEAIKNGEIT